MRYLSVCSGIEAASVAWQGLGWTPVAFSEIEAFGAAVLEERFPNVPNLGDMQDITAAQIAALGGADLLVGGTPCQPFSAAGQRAGFADQRGDLTLDFCRLADELNVAHVLWENVPGALWLLDRSREEARLLGLSLRLEQISTSLIPAGWRRKRRFERARATAAECITLQMPETPAPDASVPSTLTDVLEPWGPQLERYRLSAPLSGHILTRAAQMGWPVAHHISAFKPSYYTRGKDGAPSAISPPLSADADRGDQDICIFEMRIARNDRGTPIPTIVRRLTPIEWERLQGLPPGWTDIAFRGRRATDGPRYRAIGNSMAVPCMRWLGQRIATIHQTTTTVGIPPAHAIWCWRSASSQPAS